jgi:hypothetical protein
VQATPTVAGAQLRSDIIFKISMAASMESEQDIPDFASKIVRASSVALARKIGQSVIQGNGATDISGMLKNLSTSSTNQTAGKIVSTDITNLFFRAQPIIFSRSLVGCCVRLMSSITTNRGRSAVPSSRADRPTSESK